MRPITQANIAIILRIPSKFFSFNRASVQAPVVLSLLEQCPPASDLSMKDVTYHCIVFLEARTISQRSVDVVIRPDGSPLPCHFKQDDEMSAIILRSKCLHPDKLHRCRSLWLVGQFASLTHGRRDPTRNLRHDGLIDHAVCCPRVNLCIYCL